MLRPSFFFWSSLLLTVLFFSTVKSVNVTIDDVPEELRDWLPKNLMRAVKSPITAERKSLIPHVYYMIMAIQGMREFVIMDKESKFDFLADFKHTISNVKDEYVECKKILRRTLFEMRRFRKFVLQGLMPPFKLFESIIYGTAGRMDDLSHPSEQDSCRGVIARVFVDTQKQYDSLEEEKKSAKTSEKEHEPAKTNELFDI